MSARDITPPERLPVLVQGARTAFVESGGAFGCHIWRRGWFGSDNLDHLLNCRLG